MELRKPQEDSELNDQKEFPELERIPGQTLTGQALADLFMVFEFLHNFGETLGFDMESLPSMQSLHRSLTSDNTESEDELLSIMTHLLVCTIEDPGIPNPLRHTTLLGQSLRQADITNANISEILRIYLYAVATGEVRQQSGINFERDRDRKVADHHQSDADMILSSTTGRNSSYYEHLYETARWKLSECLREKPFVALNATIKAKILAQLCNDLLLNKAVVKQIDGSLESQSQLKKDRYLLENKIRKYKSWHMRKLRMESYEKSQSLAMEKATLIKSDMDNLKSGEMCFQMNTESSNSLTKNHSNLTNASSVDNLTDMVLDQKDDYLNSTDATLSEEKDESSPSKIDLDSSSITNGKTTPDINSLLTKNIINKNISRELDISIDAGLDEEISDLESEGTQAEDVSIINYRIRHALFIVFFFHSNIIRLKICRYHQKKYKKSWKNFLKHLIKQKIFLRNVQNNYVLLVMVRIDTGGDIGIYRMLVVFLWNHLSQHNRTYLITIGFWKNKILKIWKF